MVIQDKIALAKQNGYTDEQIYGHLLTKAQSFGKSQEEFDSYLKEKGISLAPIAEPKKEGFIGKRVGLVGGAIAQKIGERVLADKPIKSESQKPVSTGLPTTKESINRLIKLGKYPSVGWGGVAKYIATGSFDEAAKSVKESKTIGDVTREHIKDPESASFAANLAGILAKEGGAEIADINTNLFTPVFSKLLQEGVVGATKALQTIAKTSTNPKIIKIVKTLTAERKGLMGKLVTDPEAEAVARKAGINQKLAQGWNEEDTKGLAKDLFKSKVNPQQGSFELDEVAKTRLDKDILGRMNKGVFTEEDFGRINTLYKAGHITNKSKFVNILSKGAQQVKLEVESKGLPEQLVDVSIKPYFEENMAAINRIAVGHMTEADAPVAQALSGYIKAGLVYVAGISPKMAEKAIPATPQAPQPSAPVEAGQAIAPKVEGLPTEPVKQAIPSEKQGIPEIMTSEEAIAYGNQIKGNQEAINIVRAENKRLRAIPLPPKEAGNEAITAHLRDVTHKAQMLNEVLDIAEGKNILAIPQTVKESEIVKEPAQETPGLKPVTHEVKPRAKDGESVTTIIKDKKAILKQIDDAIKSAPAETGEQKRFRTNMGKPRVGVLTEKVTGKTVEFKIDGGFKIVNTKEALSEFRKRISASPEKIIVGTERTTAPRSNSIAGNKEKTSGLIPIDKEGYFTDGIMVVMGEAPTKAKPHETRKNVIKFEEIGKILNTKTTPAEFQYYFADNHSFKGTSDNPIATFKDEPSYVLFKVNDTFVTYDQDRFNVIRNRYPEAKYGIGTQGELVAYKNGNSVAVLMAMRDGRFSKTEPKLTIANQKIQDTKITEEAAEESQESYDALELSAKFPTVVFSPHTEVKPEDREFFDKVTQIVDADLARLKLIEFGKKLVGNIAEKQKQMGKGVLGYFSEPKPRYPYSNLLGSREELEAKRIRLLNINDLVSFSHEVGHGLHSYLQGAGEDIRQYVTDNRKDFMRCSQYVRPLVGEISSGHLNYRKDWRELFADFTAMYLFHPTKLMEIAPNITRHIDNLMSKYNLQEAVADVRNVDDMSVENKNPEKIGELVYDAFRGAMNTGIESAEDLSTRFFNAIGTPFWRGMNKESFAPVYRAVFDNFVYKKNAVEKDFYENLNLESFMKMPDESRARIVQAYFTGNMPNFKRYFSSDELKKNFQMNDTEISEYGRIKTYLDRVVNELIVETAKLNSRYYKITNPEERESVEAMIRANIQRLGGYIPIYRDGSGGFKVYGEMGAETTFFQLYQTEKDAVKAASEFRLQGYTKVEVYKKKQVAQAALNKWKRLSLFQLQELLGSEGIPKDNPIVKMIMSKLKAGKVSFMLKREWIPGYEQNEDGLINSLASFTDTSIRNYIKAKAKSEAEDGLSKISSTKEPIMYDYANGYIEDAFKFNKSEFTTFHKLAYWNFLSLRMSWLAVNLMQPFVMTAPYLTTELGLIKGTEVWGRAYQLLTQEKTGELKDVIERAANEGLFRAYFTEYMMGAQMKKKPNEYGKVIKAVSGWFDYKNKPTYIKQQILKLGMTIDRNFDSAMGIMGIVGERINREHATIAGYLSGKERGLQGEELYAYIKKMLSVTQVDYGKLNDPTFVRQQWIGQPIVKLGYTFSTFASSYHSFIWYLTKQGLGFTQKGWQKPTLNGMTGGGQAWFNGWLIAGLMGLPFGAGVLLNKHIRKTTKKDPWLEMRMKQQWSADLLWRGIPAMEGWDMSRSAGMGDFLGRYNNLDDAIFGVYKGWYNRIGYGTKNISRGKIFEGIMNFCPLFTASMVDVVRMTNEMKKGVPVTVGGVALKGEPSVFEMGSKFLGFQPTRFTAQYNLTQYQRFLTKEMNSVTSRATSLYAQGLRMKDKELRDKAVKLVTDWNKGLPKDLGEFKIKISEQGVKMTLEREKAGYSRYRKGIVSKGLEYQRRAIQ